MGWEKMKTFLNLPKFEEAQIAILPVPFESTTSYKKGTKNGPKEIIEASNELYLYDPELKIEPYKIGITTLKEIKKLKELENLKSDKFIIALGGEHTITYPLVKKFPQKDLSILQIDAHADLKDEFDGSKLSHACVMKRISEFNKNITQVGIRALDKDESDYIQRHKINTFFAHEKFDVKKILKTLKKNVYVTIDLDGFDPTVIPDVGTPEPAGLQFKQVTDLLKEVFKYRNVVGADVVELCPSKNSELSAYSSAKLVYKLIGFKAVNSTKNQY
jgi:agmatinase